MVPGLLSRIRAATSAMRLRARGLSAALSNLNSTSAASVTLTCLSVSPVCTLSSSDDDVSTRSTTGSSMSTTLASCARAAAGATASAASPSTAALRDRDIDERLDARHDDVDLRDALRRSGERRLQVHRRVLLDERRAEAVGAHAVPVRLAGDEVLLAALGVDECDPVEHVAALLGVRVLDVREDAVAE